MHQLVATPFLTDDLVVLRPGSRKTLRLPVGHFEQLRGLHAEGGDTPDWLTVAALAGWGVSLPDGPLRDAVLVRPRTELGYGRATWELNLGCNYDCEHCYLDTKRFEGLDFPDRVEMLEILRDAGVVWLQMTGGEPMIDRWFVDSYRTAFDLGMMIQLATNGSRLWRDEILNLFVDRPPYQLAISVYGASPVTYDELVRRKGAFDAFHRGLTAGVAAGLPINLNLVVTHTNDRDLDNMIALAEGFGLPYQVYSNMSPTVAGTARSTVTQSLPMMTTRKRFGGCNAGRTFFHVNPFGIATTCKIARADGINLLTEGLAGLGRLGEISDGHLARGGGCTGCSVQDSCSTCMPLVELYRKARAPLDRFCQHRKGGEVIINAPDDSEGTAGAGSRAADPATGRPG